MKDDLFYRGITRFTTDLIIFFSVLFCPWWISMLLIIAGIIYFHNFIESFLAGLLLDALYGTPSASVLHFRLYFSATFLFFWFAGDLIKRKLRILEI